MLHITQGNSRNTFKRIKICKIGDPWCTDHRNINNSGFLLPVKTLRQAVFIFYLDIQIRSHTDHRDPASLFQHFHTRVQNGLISTELVDDQSLNHRLFVFFQKFHCTDQLCKNASPVNITNKEDRCLGHFCHSHIYDIFIFKIDLCRASCTLDHNNVIFFGKGIVGFHNIRNQCFLIFKIISGTHGPQNFPVYDHLGTNIIGRLQKDGVHKNRRFDPGCFRLHDLSPSHLQTILCDK